MSFLVSFFLLFWHFNANCQGLVLNEVQGLGGLLKKLIPQPVTQPTPLYIPPITTQKPVETAIIVATTAIPSPTTNPPVAYVPPTTTATTTTPPATTTTPPATTTTTEVPTTTTTTTTTVPTVAPTETVSPPGDSTTTTTTTTTETTVSNETVPVSPDVVIPTAYIPPITETTQPLPPPVTEPPPVPTVTDTVSTTTAPVQNNPFLYQGPQQHQKRKKYITLNKDGVVEDLDPPHSYGEGDTEKTPNLELRPYQEITTSDKWSIDPKDFAEGIDVAVEAHEAHVQGSAMLKAQCKSKLCNFPHD